MTELRTLRWRITLDYLGGPEVLCRVLVRRRQEGQSQRRRCDDKSRVREGDTAIEAETREKDRFAGVVLLPLKIEDGDISQGDASVLI